MELEGDLGVDSIKRVEILSALQDQAPHLPDVDAAEMAGLRTLGDIVARLGSTVTPSVTPIVAPAPVAAPPADDRYIDRLVAAPAAGMVASFAGKPLLVIDGGSGRGEAVVDAARAAGLDARLATEPADGAGGILILTGLRPITSPEEGLALSRDAFASVVATARLAQKPALLALPLELGGGLGLEPAPGHQAWTAGLLGLGPRPGAGPLDGPRGPRQRGQPGGPRARLRRLGAAPRRDSGCRAGRGPTDRPPGALRLPLGGRGPAL
jgi:hypothetical protein